MKLNKFELEQKMSLQDIRTIKAGCASSSTGSQQCTSANSDVESGGKESDW